MHLVLFQPDIPQNAGTMMRAAACLGITVDVVEPCGFVLSDAKMRRAGMDYLDQVDLVRHASWEAFRRSLGDEARLVLLTTRAETAYTDFQFRPGDYLILGRESAGVPDEVHEAADARLRIPLRPDLRSLNVALAGAMVLGEALRQTEGFPTP